MRLNKIKILNKAYSLFCVVALFFLMTIKHILSLFCILILLPYSELTLPQLLRTISSCFHFFIFTACVNKTTFTYSHLHSLKVLISKTSMRLK